MTMNNATTENNTAECTIGPVKPKQPSQPKPTFTPERVRAIRSELLKLKPATPARVRADRPLTVKDVIANLAPTLLKMRNKGFSSSELVEHLGKQGVVVKATTLTKYLKLHQKQAEGGEKPQASQTA